MLLFVCLLIQVNHCTLWRGVKLLYICSTLIDGSCVIIVEWCLVGSAAAQAPLDNKDNRFFKFFFLFIFSPTISFLLAWRCSLFLVRMCYWQVRQWTNLFASYWNAFLVETQTYRLAMDIQQSGQGSLRADLQKPQIIPSAWNCMRLLKCLGICLKEKKKAAVWFLPKFGEIIMRSDWPNHLSICVKKSSAILWLAQT